MQQIHGFDTNSMRKPVDGEGDKEMLNNSKDGSHLEEESMETGEGRASENVIVLRNDSEENDQSFDTTSSEQKCSEHVPLAECKA